MGAKPRRAGSETKNAAPIARQTSSPKPPALITDEAFRSELWRALIIVVRAFIKRYGFRPPRLD